MTGPVDPLRALERRQTRRRAEDRRASPAADGGANLPVVIETAGPRPQDRPDPSAADAAAAFAAHLYGQTGQKRGLRAGQPAIDQARAAYLGAEFSGPDDRRPPKGLLKKAEI
ncbi:MAG: hypothetical protein ACOY4K_03970 [Pseudomonadota bacterium]